MRIIDSHAHSIAAHSEEYPHHCGDLGHTLAALEVPQLVDEMANCGVSAALVVQRTQAYGLDNSMICDATAAHPNALPVCAVTAVDPQCGLVARKWRARGAVGFRLMGSPKTPSTDWLDGPGSASLWQAANDLGAPICVHFFPGNRSDGLAYLSRISAEFPAVNLVIDHLSNGVGTDAGIDAPLLDLMRMPRVFLKVTAIPLRRLRDEGRMNQIVSEYVERFGAERIMWGSDVTQSQGTYAELVNLGLEAVSHLSNADQELIMAGACTKAYGLDRL